MLRQCIIWCSWALFSSALSSTALGQAYEKLLDFEDHIRVGGNEYEWIWTHAFVGTTGYCVVRGTESQITPTWESQITKIQNVDTTPSTTELVSSNAWFSCIGGRTEPEDSILSGHRMGIVDGDYLEFLDVDSDAIYRAHKTTGALSIFVSNDAVKAHTGLGSARFIEANAVSPDGAMAFYDQDSDDILLAEVNSNGDLTSNGKVSTLISDAELDALYSYSPTNNVSGGMTFDAAGNLYWTPSQFGSTGPHSGCVYKRTPDGTLSKILDEADIQGVIESYHSIVFSDIFAAPDGNIYFGEMEWDGILYFHPDDPVNTLAVFITEAEIQAGPAGPEDFREIKALNAVGNKLTWNIREKFYDLYAKELAGTPGDFDKDGDIDLWDAAGFQRCFDVLINSNGCAHVDYNTNGAIDLDDWVEFEAGFDGPV